MPHMTEVDPRTIKIEKQVRTEFSQAEMDELTASIKAHGVLQPPLVTKELRLLAGERRVRCSITAGLAKIPVIITDRMLTDTEVRLLQLAENIHRADLSGYEKWLACTEILCGNPGWTQRELAKHLHLSESMVVRLLSPSNTSAAWQEALKAGKCGLSDCYAAAKLPESEQASLLSMKLAGASRDAIEQAGRKSRHSKPDSVRVTRCKCPLSSGTCVTVSGAAMSLSDMIEAMQELLKKAKRASEQGWDCVTFQRACKAEAKAK